MARFEILDSLPAGRYEIVEEKAPEPFGKRLNREIAEIPRQVSLTARHAIEGVGDTLDFVSSPIRGALNAVLPDGHQIKPGGGRWIADRLGLETPQNETERIVGAGARMGLGSAVPVGIANQAKNAIQGSTAVRPTAQQAAQAATKAPSVSGEVFKAMGANPGMQAISATSGGLAGQYTAETGGDDMSQFAASLFTSVASPLSINKAQQLASAGQRMVKSRLPSSAPEIAARVDLTINNALRDSDMQFSALPANVRTSIRSDVQRALQADGELSGDAIRRLAEYRIANATPTVATVTLDPAAVTQQRNLAKLGMNSKDRAAQELGNVEFANNRQLINNLNDLGAGTPDDVYAGGQKVMGALQDRIAKAKSMIDARYDAARATTGRAAALDPAAFTNAANDALDQALLGGKLPGDVRNLLNKVATGEMPLTVDVAEQFKTRIGDLQRASMDKSERMALGLVRQSLDNTPLIDGQGQQAVDAFNRARRLNRAWESIVEKTPALQAVRDGVEPDKFVQTYIIGNGTNANTMDLAMLRRSVKGNPEAMDAIKTQITSYLKRAALNGAADEVGNFSQSAYNKALKAIGDRKLAMFFDPEEVVMLKATGRVASYEQFQPKGSAVNNSNTAGALGGFVERVANSPLLAKIPFGNQLAMPAQNISIGVRSNAALDVPRGLLVPQVREMSAPPGGLLMSPAAFFMQQDEKRQGLLSP